MFLVCLLVAAGAGAGATSADIFAVPRSKYALHVLWCKIIRIRCFTTVYALSMS